jgi:hypothetical protein
MEIQKTLDQIAWNVPESVYREDPALSYSTLAKFEREGYDKLDSLFDHISTPSLTEGSMVDCLITGSVEEFEEQYCVADFPSIGDKEKLVSDYIFNNYHTLYHTFEDIPATYILEAANTYEFQRNWKDDTRVRELTKRCSPYYNVKVQAGDKTVVSIDTMYKVQAMVKALRESPVTCGYFAEDDEMSPVRRYYQLKFKAKIDGVDYRCMMDEVIVNYEKKVIVPIDLKTSGKKEWHFEDSFMQWMYPIQARLYAAILKANLEKDLYFKDFTVKNYRFIVVNKESLTPLVWEFPLTFSVGDLVDKKENVFRNPFTIGKELRNYLDCKPAVPNGINQFGVNMITCLKKA